MALVEHERADAGGEQLRDALACSRGEQVLEPDRFRSLSARRGALEPRDLGGDITLKMLPGAPCERRDLDPYTFARRAGDLRPLCDQPLSCRLSQRTAGIIGLADRL